MSGRPQGPPPAGGVTGDGSARAPSDDAHYRLLFESMMEGFAHCRMLYDAEGRPDDWVYLSVNPAFTRLTGIEDAVGNRVTEVLPTIRGETPELLEVYGRVVATGEHAEFDIDFTPLGKWLHVSATRLREGEFVASRCSTWTGCSACSSGCTVQTSSRAPASGSPTSAASWAGTAAAAGRRPRRTLGRRSTSAFRGQVEA